MIPTIASLSEDAMLAVPLALRQDPSPWARPHANDSARGTARRDVG